MYELSVAVASPEDFGAIGDGVADDTRAIQDMFNTAIAQKLKIVIPAKHYHITRTIHVVAPRGVTEFRLDVDADGDNQFLFSGQFGACFQIVGLRFSTWKGLKVKLADAVSLVGFDLDTDEKSYSTSNITFIGCDVNLGKGIKQRGWRLGLTSGGGADISVIHWDSCSVYGNYGAVVKGQTGWQNQGPNSLSNVLNACFGAYLDMFFSNTSTESKNTGNGAFYFYGTGTSHNNLEFDISNAQTYLISGGRLELGKHVLRVNTGVVAPSITFSAVEISNFDPTDSQVFLNGCLFFLDMPCSLKIDNCNIAGTIPYTKKMIRAFGGGDGEGTGTIIIDAGSITAAKDLFYEVNLNRTKWAVYVRGVGRLVDGRRKELMNDKGGLVAAGQER